MDLEENEGPGRDSDGLDSAPFTLLVTRPNLLRLTGQAMRNGLNIIPPCTLFNYELFSYELFTFDGKIAGVLESAPCQPVAS
jgi:hypothetical protein